MNVIEQASVTLAEDGGVLITLPRTGMDPFAPTAFAIEDGKLKIEQGNSVHVCVEIPDRELILAIVRSDDVSIVEVDEDGFVFHESVARAE